MKDIEEELANLKVFSLGYYDGTTEGFAYSIKDFGFCYFKLIAWDGWQDMRLFALSPVDISLYTELTKIYIRNLDFSQGLHKVPSWEIKNKKDDNKHDQIMETCLNSLYKSNILILGEHIDDDSTKVIDIGDTTKIRVNKKLYRMVKNGDQPDVLENWVGKENDSKNLCL